MSFYRETLQTRPRKAKRCQWCDEVCLPGERRFVVAGIWEGDFFTAHFHPECHPEYHPECQKACHDYIWQASYDGEYPEEPMERGGQRMKWEIEEQKETALGARQ